MLSRGFYLLCDPLKWAQCHFLSLLHLLSSEELIWREKAQFHSVYLAVLTEHCTGRGVAIKVGLTNQRSRILLPWPIRAEDWQAALVRAPAVNNDVIDSRDKNWELRTVKGVHIFITKQQLRCCAKWVVNVLLDHSWYSHFWTAILLLCEWRCKSTQIPPLPSFEISNSDGRCEQKWSRRS